MSVADYVSPDQASGSWNLDPGLLVPLVTISLLYIRGAIALRRTGSARVVSDRRIASFSGGIAVVAAAVASPLDAISADLFSAHMAQHLLLIVVAPPMIVYGRPVVVTALGLPSDIRRALDSLRRKSLVRRAARPARSVVVVWALHAVTLWAWHLPDLYQAAVQIHAIHVLEHVTLLGSAMLFWGLVIPDRGHSILGPAGAAVLAFTVSLQSSALGALLVFVPTVLYPIHGLGAEAWGISALADQQVAGALMWIPAGIVYMAAVILLLMRWIKDVERRMLRKESGPLAVVGREQ